MTNKQQLIERIIDMAENNIDKDILSHYAQSMLTSLNLKRIDNGRVLERLSNNI